jgi:hypothetical protein
VDFINKSPHVAILWLFVSLDEVRGSCRFIMAEVWRDGLVMSRVQASGIDGYYELNLIISALLTIHNALTEKGKFRPIICIQQYCRAGSSVTSRSPRMW